MSTTSQDSAALVAALSAAVAARKDSLIALRARIADLLAPIPVGVKLADDAGPVCAVARIYTGASQWSNRTWEVTIKGRGYLAGEKLLAVQCEQKMSDGHNMHFRSTEPYVLDQDWPRDEDPSNGLRWFSGRETREAAARLPAAIARYMAQCEAERQANTETLTA